MILDLLQGLFSVRATRKGPYEYASSCPGCGGEDRFIVWPGQNRYWCRGCKKNGDEIQLLRDFKGMGFREACSFLSLPLRKPKYYQISSRDQSEWVPKQFEPRNNNWRARGLKLVEYSVSLLRNSPEQLDYLQGRGLSAQSVRQFRLGYVQSTIYDTPGNWGLVETGKKSIWIPEGIVIPYFVEGEPCRVRIRLSNPGGKNRYVLVSGSSTQPFIAPMKEGLPLLLVESELCAMLLYQEAGDLVNIVATGSASNRPDDLLDRLIRRSDRVLYSLDFDEAGKKEYKWWKHQYPKIHPLPSVKGVDPTESYQKGINLRAWLKAGVNIY